MALPESALRCRASISCGVLANERLAPCPDSSYDDTPSAAEKPRPHLSRQKRFRRS